ncbi:MAG: ATP cone domain-containing protein [Bacteroidota bacterium]
MDLLITKASGEKVPYDGRKLRESLQKAGADELTVREIAKEVESNLVSGISSRKIYRQAYALLKKIEKPSAAKYKLKTAVMELGPSGYPFEKFIGEILNYEGYKTQVGIVMQGQGITHEVDVFGIKGNKQIMVECKFGNTANKKVDVRVSMYIHSRFRDLRNAWEDNPAYQGREYEGWIVTNSRFSEDALSYGVHYGMNLISWAFPQQGNLRDLIEESSLYPLTSLTSITKKEKQQLLDKGIVLCRDLMGKDELFEELGVSRTRKKKAFTEIEGLCDCF